MGGLSVRELIEFLAAGPAGGRLANAEAAPAGDARVERLAALAASGAGDLAFFFSKSYLNELPSARATMVVTGEDFVQPLAVSGLPLWKASAVVACRDPYLALALLSGRFAGLSSAVAHLEPPAASEIHPSAVVHPSARIEDRVRVGAHCVIEAGARIGEGSVLYPGCFVGPGARVGRHCVLFPRVTLYERVELGDRVRLHAGVVLGADGFGYAPAPGRHHKIYHLGKVVVEDDVEIGANSTVDRGTIGDTRVGAGAKVDNLCHLGHNSTLGKGAIVCGGTCLAGNASVGEFAYVGGMSGVVNQIHVGDGAKVGAMTLVSKDVDPGTTVAGNPQRELREHFKAHAALNKLAQKGRISRKQET